MRVIFILFFLFPCLGRSQMLGGDATFPFLKHSAMPQLTALGGVDPVTPSGDASMGFYNPALLRHSMHTQVNAVFNDQYGGISVYHLSFAYHHNRSNTNFLWGVNYFDYGSVTQTDASGNAFGEFHPRDWVMQLSASRKYLEKWHYGATLKFIQSNYGAYRANAIAMDFGIHFTDSARLVSAAALVQNLGSQLRTYDGVNKEELPFDLKFGLHKRLAKAPFSFSVTLQRMNRFDLYDEDLNNETDKLSFQDLFRHFVFASTIHLNSRLEVHLAYNVLRRKELGIGNAGGGLHGFSGGLGLLLGRLQFRYACAWLQPRVPMNQLGIGMTLNKFFGWSNL